MDVLHPLHWSREEPYIINRTSGRLSVIGIGCTVIFTSRRLLKRANHLSRVCRSLTVPQKSIDHVAKRISFGDRRERYYRLLFSHHQISVTRGKRQVDPDGLDYTTDHILLITGRRTSNVCSPARFQFFAGLCSQGARCAANEKRQQPPGCRTPGHWPDDASLCTCIDLTCYV